MRRGSPLLHMRVPSCLVACHSWAFITCLVPLLIAICDHWVFGTVSLFKN